MQTITMRPALEWSLGLLLTLTALTGPLLPDLTKCLRTMAVVCYLPILLAEPRVWRLTWITAGLSVNLTYVDAVLLATVLPLNLTYIHQDLSLGAFAMMLQILLMLSINHLCASAASAPVLPIALICLAMLLGKVLRETVARHSIRLQDIREEARAIEGEIIAVKAKFFDTQEEGKLSRSHSSTARDPVLSKLKRLNPVKRMLARTSTHAGSHFSPEQPLFPSARRKYTLDDGSMEASGSEMSINWQPEVTITSFDSSVNGRENDLSAEEADGLITNIMSAEYVLWKHKKRPSLRPGENLGLLQQLQQFASSFPAVSNTVFTLAPLRVLIEENEELAEVLYHVGEWDFNTLDLVKLTSKPLKEVSNYLFSTHSLLEKFIISRDAFGRFLQEVESRYHKENYYHNALHAADVLNSVVFLLTSGLYRCGHILDLEVFALMVAAIGHDMDHPGVNNAYLVNKSDQLALRYNDKSVLEMMHAANLFGVISKADCNIAVGLCIADFQRFRKIVINLILATDLQRHFSIQADYRVDLEDLKKTLEDETFRIKTLEICIKCADIGHAAKETSLHVQWTHLISHEFFAQGDSEAALGLPISPLCGRGSISIPKSQIGFLTVMVKPLFTLWEEMVRMYGDWEDDCDLPFEMCNRRIGENLLFWQGELEAVEQGRQYDLPSMTAPMLETSR